MNGETIYHPLVREWAERLRAEQRRSPHTLRAYLATAQRLIDFLAEHRGEGVNAALLASVEAADLRSFLAYRRAEGLGNASAARELSAVRGFLRFVGGDDAAIPALRGPRVKRGLPRAISPDEAMALAETVAESARDGWQGVRDLALLLLLYGAGLRIAEALALPAAVLPLGESLVVTGKGLSNGQVVK